MKATSIAKGSRKTRTILKTIIVQLVGMLLRKIETLRIKENEANKTGLFLRIDHEYHHRFSINFTGNILIFPLFGWHISVEQNFVLGGCYTAISLIRSYVIRRWFNAKLQRAAMVLAKGV
jgi:hypothetical protein